MTTPPKEEPMNYYLTPTQQTRWKEKIKEYLKEANCTQKEAASILGIHESAFSPLKHGDKKEIRKLFTNRTQGLKELNKRLNCNLKDLFESIQDKVFKTPKRFTMYRIPGFEQYKPVLEIFFPPETQEIQYHLPNHQTALIQSKQQPPNTLSTHLVHSTAGRVDLSLMTEATLLQFEHLCKIILIRKPTGADDLLLKALVARLEEKNINPAPWLPGTLSKGNIIYQQNLNEMPPGSRSRLLKEVKEQGATLLTTTNLEDPCSDIPTERITCIIRKPGPAWANDYLIHIEKNIGLQLDLDPLREWLHKSLFASSSFSSTESLGILAKHVLNGGDTPIKHNEIIELARKNWIARLREDSEDIIAELLLRDTDSLLFQALAERFCLSSGRISRSELYDIFNQSEMPWKKRLSHLELNLLPALLKIGLFQEMEEGKYIAPVNPFYFVSILGRRLIAKPSNKLLENVFLKPDWHGALDAATEQKNGLETLLRHHQNLPFHIRSQSYIALTRLLASEHHNCRDENLLKQVFIELIYWWSCWPASTRSTTLHLSTPTPMIRPHPQEALICGYSPLVVLGVASQNLKNKRILFDISTAEILDFRLDPKTKHYLQLREKTLSEEAVKIALVLAAPFHCNNITVDSNWKQLSLQQWRDNSLPLAINRDDLRLWMPIGAAALFSKDEPEQNSEGLAIWPISQFMFVELPKPYDWATLLQKAFRKQQTYAVDHFFEALNTALKIGGKYNLSGLKRLWEKGIRVREKDKIKKRLEEYKKNLIAFPEWFFYTDLLNWVFKELLDTKQLWTDWTDWLKTLDDPIQQKIPWKSFKEAGIKEKEILEWALMTHPKELFDPHKYLLQSIQKNKQQAMFALPEDYCQTEILYHFSKSNDVELLRMFLQIPNPIKETVENQLKEKHPKTYRCLYLQSMSFETWDKRIDALNRLSPRYAQVGEKSCWADLFIRSVLDFREKPKLFFYCGVQFALAHEEQEREEWIYRLMGFLFYCMTQQREIVQERLSQWFIAQSQALSPNAQKIKEEMPQLVDIFCDPLHTKTRAIEPARDIGNWLWEYLEIMMPSNSNHLVNVACWLFDQQAFTSVLLHEDSFGWWGLLKKSRQSDEEFSLLIREIFLSQEPHVIQKIMTACVRSGKDGLENIVIPCLEDPKLCATATQVCNENISYGQPELLEKVLKYPFSITQEDHLNHALALLLKLAKSDDVAAVKAFEAMSIHNQTLSLQGWKRLTLELPLGCGRATALSKWFEYINTER